MKCPNCGAEMEREDHIEPDGPAVTTLMPSAEYVCDECGYCAVWSKISGWTVLCDPKKDREGDQCA